jgi:hypothetical protein
MRGSGWYLVAIVASVVLVVLAAISLAGHGH